VHLTIDKRGIKTLNLQQISEGVWHIEPKNIGSIWFQILSILARQIQSNAFRKNLGPQKEIVSTHTHDCFMNQRNLFARHPERIE
jgi:hypothetical protein